MLKESAETFRELSSFLLKVADRRPEKVALIWENSRMSYDELKKEVCVFASSLKRLGLGKNSKVGMIMKNSPDSLCLWLGSLMAGCVFIPFNTALKGEILLYQLNDSKPDILFIDDSLLPSLGKIDLSCKIIISSKNKESDQLEDSKSLGEDNFSPPEVKPSDTAEIIYTSGTTGIPKGVSLPHYSFINRAREIAQIVSLSDNDILFNCLPFFHTSGQVMTTLPALLFGLTSSQLDWFHVTKFWSFAKSTGSTVSFLLMRMVNLLLRASEDYFVKNSVRAIMCGGVKEEIQKEFVRKFSVELVEGYGMTETCGIAIFNRINDNKVGSIGRPLSSVEVKLVNEKGLDVEKGKAGEIYLKEKIPNTMFKGYLNNLSPFISGGWFPTGDIAFQDKEGYFYYVERKKDIIRSRGENISPSQIEGIAENYHSVIECAAVGVESRDTGDEEIMLVIKAKDKIDLRDFFFFLSSKLPFFMVPRYIYFVDELPKTANQKVKRDELRHLNIDNAVDLHKIGLRVKPP